MLLQVGVYWLAQQTDTLSESSCTQHWMAMSILSRQPCRYALQFTFDTPRIQRSRCRTSCSAPESWSRDPYMHVVQHFCKADSSRS